MAKSTKRSSLSKTDKDRASYGPNGYGKSGKGSTGSGFNRSDGSLYAKQSKKKTFNPSGGTSDGTTKGLIGGGGTGKGTSRTTNSGASVRDMATRGKKK